MALVLALGVGTCVSALGLLRGLLVGSQPYAESARLVVVENQGDYDLGGRRIEDSKLSWLDYRDLEAQQRSLTSVGGISNTERTTLDTGTRTRSTPRVFVTANLLSTLGAKATLGRLLSADDFQPGAPAVALVTHDLWRSQLGADARAVGTVVRLGGQAVTVGGVISDDVVAFLRPRRTLFEDGDERSCAVIPLVPGSGGREEARSTMRRANRGHPLLTVVGRLSLGTQSATARADVLTIGQQLAAAYPATNRDRQFDVVAWHTWRTRSVDHVRPMLWAVAGLSFIVACASAVGLIAADAVRREPEMAVRYALGATRGRLGQHVLKRAISWTWPGGVLGLVLAWAMLRWLTPSEALAPGKFDVPYDPVGALVAGGLTTLAGAVLGAVGVWMLRAQNLAVGIKEAGLAVSPGRRRRMLLATIVGIQMTVAMSLGLVAGLLLRSMVHIVRIDVGFTVGESLVVRLFLPEEKYSTPGDQSAYFDDALGRVRMLPGIVSAGIADTPPLSRVTMTIGGFSLEVPGRPSLALGPLIGQRVSAGYFESVGTRILHGRAFSEDDYRSQAAVIIVDDAFCRLRMPGLDPLQAGIRVGSVRHQIVGIAHSIRGGGPLDDARATVYVLRSPTQSGGPVGHLVVRPSENATRVSERVVRELVRVDPGVVVDEPSTLRGLYATSVQDRTRTMALLVLASAGVFLLTAFSIGGALSECVENQRREIALRKALGASWFETVTRVGRHLAAPAATGLVCGIGTGWFLARTFSSQFVGVGPADPTTLVATVAAQLVLGVIAAIGPLKRALNVHPASTLRGL